VSSLQRDEPLHAGDDALGLLERLIRRGAIVEVVWDAAGFPAIGARSSIPTHVDLASRYMV
jgi:hypothetical protein